MSKQTVAFIQILIVVIVLVLVGTAVFALYGERFSLRTSQGLPPAATNSTTSIASSTPPAGALQATTTATTTVILPASGPISWEEAVGLMKACEVKSVLQIIHCESSSVMVIMANNQTVNVKSPPDLQEIKNAAVSTGLSCKGSPSVYKEGLCDTPP